MIPYPKSFESRPGSFRWPHDLSIERLAFQLAEAGTVKSGTGSIVRFFQSNLGPEGYRIRVEETGITLEAAGRNGLHYAVQTLAQMTQGELVPCCDIDDAPRFSWRGMMLDPSRHFQPKSFVLKFIDLLYMHKMNRLHLHLCDDQGWRIEIRKYPKLTEVGAWRRETQWRPNDAETDGIPHGGFYTQDDLREIVAYAEARGITVMPEIEMPGHCQAALAAYPELGNQGRQLGVSTKFGVIEDVYGVHDEVLRFLEGVLEEVLEIFPSEFIHIGGDEVPKQQWIGSPVAQARIKDLGLKNEDELQSWFIRHFDRWLTERGRRLVGWDEILEGGLAPGATVMSWRGTVGGIAAAKLGHDVVMCPTSHCYFDHYQSQDKTVEPVAIGGFTPLTKVYDFDPVPAQLSSQQAKHILGGQANLWSEYLRTGEHVEYMALPRMCALAEVLWGKAPGQDFKTFSQRLPPHLATLKRLGYNFRPLS